MPRASRSGSRRFLEARVALFWLGAGVWLTGLALELPSLTIVAIAILFVALLLRMVAARRSGSDVDEEQGTDEEGRDP